MQNKPSKCIALLLASICLSLPCAFGAAQAADRSTEATSKVPALDSFHEVIYQIWHDAWPKKDTAVLRKVLPDVEKGISSVAGAPLPGILREKKTAWEAGVKKLQAIGSDYKAAAAAGDDAKLLGAAEQLHSQYEALARVIRPALKEIDEFHAVLYMLYHHYMPDYQIEKIRSAAADLKQKMAALNKAVLPERLKKNEANFVAAKAELSKSVDSLQTSLVSNNKKKIQEAVDAVHADYERLNRLFE